VRIKQMRHPMKQLRGAEESGWNFDLICGEMELRKK
jgi:hypothetical protein